MKGPSPGRSAGDNAVAQKRMLRAERGGQPMNREYIGVDLHKAFFQVCALTDTGERRWEARWPRTADGIARFVARGVGPDSAIAVEATGPTWAFVDALGATGARVCVVDPRKTKLKAGYAAKTDRLDAVGWRMRCGARASSVSTFRRRRSANSGKCAAAGTRWCGYGRGSCK